MVVEGSCCQPASTQAALRLNVAADTLFLEAGLLTECTRALQQQLGGLSVVSKQVYFFFEAIRCLSSRCTLCTDEEKASIGSN